MDERLAAMESAVTKMASSVDMFTEGFDIKVELFAQRLLRIEKLLFLADITQIDWSMRNLLDMYSYPLKFQPGPQSQEVAQEPDAEVFPTKCLIFDMAAGDPEGIIANRNSDVEAREQHQANEGAPTTERPVLAARAAEICAAVAADLKSALPIASPARLQACDFPACGRAAQTDKVGKSDFAAQAGASAVPGPSLALPEDPRWEPLPPDRILAPGDKVKTTKDHSSANDDCVIQKGQVGKVLYIDAEGDAFIVFPNEGLPRHWLMRSSHRYLQLLANDEARGEAAAA